MFKQRLWKAKEYLNKVYLYLYIYTQDIPNTLKELTSIFGKEDVLVWTRSKGVVDPKDTSIIKQNIKEFSRAFDWYAGKAREPYFIMVNTYPYIQSPDTIDKVLFTSKALYTAGKHVIFLCDTLKLPYSLKSIVPVLEIPLPNLEDFREYAKEYDLSLDGCNPCGLTFFEFAGAYAYAEMNKKDLKDCIEEQKLKKIKDTEALTLYYPKEQDSFDYLGGLHNLKEFLKLTAGKPDAKGVMLLGIPGTGKTAIGKALGKHLNLPVVIFDFGAVFGSLVGESEEKMRRVINIINVLSPCILLVDEIEKGMGGVNSSHMSDGGTGARVFSYFLRWLEERPEGIYVVATCNDIMKIPPEFIRSERWDAVFGIDFPTQEERDVIWNIWGKHYNVSVEYRPPDDFWTGADIRTCCRLAKIMGQDVISASRFVNPVYNVYKDKLDELREYMKKCTIPASLKALP